LNVAILLSHAAHSADNFGTPLTHIGVDIKMKWPQSRNFFLWIGLGCIAIACLGIFINLPLFLIDIPGFCGLIAMFLHVFPSSQQWLKKLLNKEGG